MFSTSSGKPSHDKLGSLNTGGWEFQTLGPTTANKNEQTHQTWQSEMLSYFLLLNLGRIKLIVVPGHVGWTRTKYAPVNKYSQFEVDLSMHREQVQVMKNLHVQVNSNNHHWAIIYPKEFGALFFLAKKPISSMPLLISPFLYCNRCKKINKIKIFY